MQDANTPDTGGTNNPESKELNYRIASFIVNFRWIVLPFVLSAFIAIGYGITTLVPTNDYRIWLDPSEPTLHAFDNIEDTYSKNNNIFFVVEPKNGDVFNAKTLEATQWLTKKSWQIPHSSRVDSLTNFQYTEPNGDDLTVRDLVPEGMALNSGSLKKVKQYVNSEPALKNKLISRDGKVTAVNVLVPMPGKSPMENSETALAARAIKEEFKEKFPSQNIYLTGWAMLTQVFPELAMGDMGTLIPLMYLVLLIALGLILRSVSGVLITLIILTVSIFGGMGFAGWMGFKITTISSVAPTIIMTLAAADCIHILLHYLKHLKLGVARKQAMIMSLAHNLLPIALTTVSTVIGFLCYNFNDSPPFREYGNIVAVGMVLAFLSSVLLIPALISIFPSWPWSKKKRKAISEQPVKQASYVIEDAISGFIIRNPKKLFAAVAMLGLVLSGMAMQNDLNEEYVKYVHPRIEFRRDSDFAGEKINGIYDIQYSLDSGKPDGINDPEYFKVLDEFTKWLRQQENITSVSSVADTIKRINQNMNGGEASAYQIPASADQVAQYMLMYEMSLPLGMDLTTMIDESKSSTRLIVGIKNIRLRGLIDIDRKAQDWLKANAPKAISEKAQGGSIALVFAHVATRMVETMTKSSVVALMLISGLMLLCFRSVRVGLVSLIPNLLPGLMAFGVWASYNGLVNLSLCIALGVTLGIVVDDTIHFLSHYHRSRKKDLLSAREALIQAFRDVGRAVLVTSLILVCGFGVLLWSSFTVNSHMAIVTIWTVGFAILTDFFLLPPVLLLFDRWIYPDLQAPQTTNQADAAPSSGGAVPIGSPLFPKENPMISSDEQYVIRQEFEGSFETTTNREMSFSDKKRFKTHGLMQTFLIVLIVVMAAIVGFAAIANGKSPAKEPAAKSSTSSGKLKKVKNTPKTRALALKIALRSKAAISGFKSLEADLKMVLNNKKGATHPRFMRLKILEVKGDGERSMVMFHRPAAVAGTTVLTYSHPRGDQDQWLYLPAIRRVKRISTSNRSGPFMGSQLAFEDIGSDEVGQYTHNYVKKGKCSKSGKALCHIIERRPINVNSGYFRQLVWVNTKTHLFSKIKYFDRKNSPLKTLTYKSYKKIGSMSRPGHMSMVNLQNGKSTEVFFTNYNYKIGLRSKDFTKNSLQRAM